MTDPTPDVDVVQRISVGARSFRVRLVGPAPSVANVVGEIRQLEQTSADEQRLLEGLARICQREHVTLSDVLDLVAPSPIISLAEKVRQVARFTDVQKAIVSLEYLFRSASDDELLALVNSTDRGWVRSYVESVLDDLDERRAAILIRLRDSLPTGYGYLLLPPD